LEETKSHIDHARQAQSDQQSSLKLKHTFPPGADGILATLIPGVQSTLADNLVGIYLRGSLATGDFIETSDIDFLVATERPVSEAEAAALIEMHAHLAALPNPYADKLEGAYLDPAALRRFEPGRRFLTVECETPLRWKEHETSWLIERWVLREKGVALLGPDPKTLVDPISPEELREAVRQRLREWATWAANPHDPEWLPPRSHQAYVVETMCRALYTLTFGELVSKRVAAEWAVSALPAPWRRLVEEAVARRADETPDPDTIGAVLGFVEWAASEGEEYLTRAYDQG
jgi:predicted nucleotidyltransferase